MVEPELGQLSSGCEGSVGAVAQVEIYLCLDRSSALREETVHVSLHKSGHVNVMHNPQTVMEIIQQGEGTFVPVNSEICPRPSSS